MLHQRLERGERVTGVFAPAGAIQSFATPGVLTWTNTGGAELELVERSDPWPRDFEELFSVHGVPHEGYEVTLLDARVRRRSSSDQTSHISSGTLALGALIDNDYRWPRANYRPGSLHEWLPETGLSINHPEDDPEALRVEWRPPQRRTVNVWGGEVSLYPGRDYAWGYGSGWSIDTTMTFGTRSEEPLTIEGHWRSFGNPLLSFSVFAADRPDDVVYESYYDPEAKRHVVVLRRDRAPLEREWAPIPGVFVFRADDLENVSASLGAWFDVWRRSYPALGLFRETIEQGNSFSAPRFLTLYTAAEAYWTKTWKAKTGKSWSLRRLVEHAGLSEGSTGCTKDALALIGEARRYHAHLGPPSQHTVDQVVGQTFESTRRLHALLQACLMRDLGLDPVTVTRLLRDHYRSWPLP